MLTQPSTPFTIRPRWTWYRGAFVEGLRITIDQGSIRDVSHKQVTGEIDREDLLLLPGLVNPHTHLEFSSLDQPIAHDGTFASWIRRVVAWRRTQTELDHAAALQRGLLESQSGGVVALGEIATRSISWASHSPPEKLLPGEQPFQVIFRESLGLSPGTVTDQLGAIREHLSGGVHAERARPGISPHAPYSVHPDLFRGLLELAHQSRCPVAMHLAETEEELELLRSGTGPLAELLAEWGLWKIGQPAEFRSPEEVLRLLVNLPQVLIIHGNYLRSEEIDLLSGRENTTVVYCPRTHSYFGHTNYPLQELLKRGVRVALGTDSRASSPDLNLLADLRHAAQLHPEVSPAQWMEMVTTLPAQALGLPTGYGRIEMTAPARFCELVISPQVQNPVEALMSGSVFLG